MKAIFALAAVALFSVSSLADNKPMPKDVPVAIYNTAKGTAKIVGEARADILEFAQENGCYHGTEKESCIYEMPLDVVGTAFVAVAKVGGELTILATEIPASALNFAEAGFRGCQRNAPEAFAEAVCKGFAYVTGKSGEFLVKAGHYGAASLNMQGRSVKQSFSLVASSVKNMGSLKVEDSVQDLIAAGIFTPGCLVASVVKFVVVQDGINCDSWVASERIRWDVEDGQL